MLLLLLLVVVSALLVRVAIVRPFRTLLRWWLIDFIHSFFLHWFPGLLSPLRSLSQNKNTKNCFFALQHVALGVTTLPTIQLSNSGKIRWFFRIEYPRNPPSVCFFHALERVGGGQKNLACRVSLPKRALPYPGQVHVVRNDGGRVSSSNVLPFAQIFEEYCSDETICSFHVELTDRLLMLLWHILQIRKKENSTIKRNPSSCLLLLSIKVESSIDAVIIFVLWKVIIFWYFSFCNYFWITNSFLVVWWHLFLLKLFCMKKVKSRIESFPPTPASIDCGKFSFLDVNRTTTHLHLHTTISLFSNIVFVSSNSIQFNSIQFSSVRFDSFRSIPFQYQAFLVIRVR